MNDLYKLRRSGWLSPEEVSAEYIDYQMAFVNHQRRKGSESLNSHAATMEYVDYQMGFQNDPVQNRSDSLIPEEVLRELFDYQMLINQSVFHTLPPRQPVATAL